MIAWKDVQGVGIMLGKKMVEECVWVENMRFDGHAESLDWQTGSKKMDW